jgi:hypothetical protein
MRRKKPVYPLVSRTMETINMRDLHAALGIPLPSKKDKKKEDAPSTVSSPRSKQVFLLYSYQHFAYFCPRQRRLVKTARKSTGWRNFIQKEGATSHQQSRWSFRLPSIIDLTSDASDEDEEKSEQVNLFKERELVNTPNSFRCRYITFFMS